MKPYNQRTDLQKIHSQWRKLSGLHSQDEWSAAVIRAATAAELAANFAIRKELEVKRGLPPAFVNDLLRWANGIDGKFSRLLLPIARGNDKKQAAFRQLKGLAEEVNKSRNAIVHSGEFRSAKQASEVIDSARRLIERLVRRYQAGFTLPPLD